MVEGNILLAIECHSGWLIEKDNYIIPLKTGQQISYIIAHFQNDQID